jgi:hypothetical protein
MNSPRATNLALRPNTDNTLSSLRLCCQAKQVMAKPYNLVGRNCQMSPKNLGHEKKIPEWQWYRSAVCSFPRDATTPHTVPGDQGGRSGGVRLNFGLASKWFGGQRDGILHALGSFA